MHRYGLTAIVLAGFGCTQAGCLEQLYRPHSARTTTAYPHPIIETDYAGEQVSEYLSRLKPLLREDQAVPPQPKAFPVPMPRVWVVPLDDGASATGRTGPFGSRALTRPVFVPPTPATVQGPGQTRPEPAPPSPEVAPAPASQADQPPPSLADISLYVDRIERQAAEQPDNLELQLLSRFLLLLARQDDKALRPISAMGKEENERATTLLQIAAATRDGQTGASDPDTAAKQLKVLNALRQELMRVADLRISTMKLVTSISGFGVYTEFPDNTFKAGDSHWMWVYCELRNFATTTDDAGKYHTRLKTQIDLYDAEGRTVRTRQPEDAEDVCVNQRNDFYLRAKFLLPKTLPPGHYTLKTTIEDLAANKIATKNLPIVLAAPN